MMRTLAGLLILTVAGMALAKPERSLPDHGKEGRPDPNRLRCICQYQEVPGCVAATTEAACNGIFDCFWGTYDKAPPRCHNFHEFYCHTEFSTDHQRARGLNCADTSVISARQQPPGCNGYGAVHFARHGHGPDYAALERAVSQILQDSQKSPGCQFNVHDQTCSTFSDDDPALADPKLDKRGLNKVRSNLNDNLSKLMVGHQNLLFRANQTTATGNVAAPFAMLNPEYAFTYSKGQGRITNERVVACDAPMDCFHHGDHYLCDSGNAGLPINAIYPRQCCCPKPDQVENLRGGRRPAEPSSGSSSSWRPGGASAGNYDITRRPRNTSGCKWFNHRQAWAPTPQALTGQPRPVCPRALPANPADPENWN